MAYDFDHPAKRRGTFSMKYDDDGFFRALIPNIRLDDDTIRIMLADMDFQCAPAITKALHKAADFGNYGYVTPDAAPRFRGSIIDWYRRRHGLCIRPEEIVYSSGALDGVEQTIAAFSRPGEGVILTYPVYSHFTSSVLRLGRKIVSCHMLYDGEGGYSMDWAAFEAACAKPENKVFVLCSPCNPLGIVWTAQELQKMAAICKENGVVLVSDEIHSDFVRAGVRHIPILAAVEDKTNLILVSGPNKSFNLMGLHCAYSVIPDEGLRAAFSKGYAPAPPTAFALAAMIAAYDESEDWLDELNACLDQNLALAVNYFHTHLPKVKVHVPDGTYVLWMDFSSYGLGAKGLVDKINGEANVCVDVGVSSDPEQGQDFVRMCLTCPRAQLEQALERISRVFSKL